MSLTEDDLTAIGKLMDLRIDPLRSEFRQELRGLRSEMNQSFDALLKRDEKREQEYLVLREQVARLEDRISTVEKKTA